ncbi:MAG TPA: response regulator [Longilinea sp.]|nr:response regulator [Longilinea sp.]
MVRILFVDDDMLMLELMDKVCQLLGYESLRCPSATDGLKIAEDQCPDLIVVDRQMAEMDGVQFVHEVRQNPQIALTPVILLSADRNCGDIEEAKRVGADGFYCKPLSFEELEEIISIYVKVPRSKLSSGMF